MNDAIRGHNALRDAGLRPRTTFGGGRVCAEEGCITILSTYNKRKLCAVHQPPVFPPAPRAERSDSSTAVRAAASTGSRLST